MVCWSHVEAPNSGSQVGSGHHGPNTNNLPLFTTWQTNTNRFRNRLSKHYIFSDSNVECVGHYISHNVLLKSQIVSYMIITPPARIRSIHLLATIIYSQRTFNDPASIQMHNVCLCLIF